MLNPTLLNDEKRANIGET